MAGSDFLSIEDLEPGELEQVIDDAARAKAEPHKFAGALSGRSIAMLFEKPSTRTRISFEVAIASMGGHAVVLRFDEMQLGRGETVEDTGMVLSRYVDGVVIRTFEHDRLVRLADAASVPVINALSDLEHPCQALADLQTIRAHKRRLAGVVLAYIGDGNNVAHSLMLGGGHTGMEVRIACPSGYEPDPDVTERARRAAAGNDGRIVVTESVAEAASGADVLYTDVWASMGWEAESAERASRFAAYQVSAEVVEMAAADCIVMHCLPAHRGEEIAAEVIDGPHSVVWVQAENRLHAQKALLARLCGG